MAHSRSVREKIILQRRQGVSIRELAKTHQLPKSTVSYWCRDIQLSPKQIEKLQNACKKAGSAKCLELAEKQRSARIQNVRVLHPKVLYVSTS